MLLFTIAAFAMGYASGAKYGTDAGILYVFVVTVHLFLNYLIMHRQPDYTHKKMLGACVVILCVYGLIVFH